MSTSGNVPYTLDDSTLARDRTRVRESLCLVRIAMIVLIVRSLVYVAFNLLGGLRTLVPVAQRGWLILVFEAVTPLLVLGFAIWMLVAVRHARRRLTSAVTCLGCGYDLKGIDATRCPECGREVEPGQVVRVA